jgi:hypothetical protein
MMPFLRQMKAALKQCHSALKGCLILPFIKTRPGDKITSEDMPQEKIGTTPQPQELSADGYSGTSPPSPPPSPNTAGDSSFDLRVATLQPGKNSSL